MKLKFRLAGRGGQGIKFVGSFFVQVAMLSNYNATLSVDYTPSVRGGPIFCDIVLSSNSIFYPFCDKDADFLIAIDQNGFERACECVCEKTISFIDANTISNAEKIIKEGTLYRVPITKWADENNVAPAVNILALGFLSQYLQNNGCIDLKEEHYLKLLDGLPKRFRETNTRSFQLGNSLYHEFKKKF